MLSLPPSGGSDSKLQAERLREEASPGPGSTSSGNPWEPSSSIFSSLLQNLISSSN